MGHFFLAGGEQELGGLDPSLGKWNMGRGEPAPSGTLITQRASFSFLLTPPISFGFVFNVVQARLKLAL